MGKRARIGVIGCGGVAGAHLPNILACDRVQLRAAADPDATRLEDFAQKSSCSYSTPDGAEIIKDNEIDGVMICASNDLHAPLAIEALDAGKHVFVEKPLALSSGDCRKIIEAAERANRGVMVGFWYHLHGAFLEIRRRIPNPYMITAQCAAGASGDSFDPASAFAPAMKPERGFAAGGSLLHQGCYLLLTPVWLANSDPVQIYAQAPENDVYNSAQVSIRFASGAVAQIQNSHIGGGGLHRKWYFEVLGGRINAGLDNQQRLVFTGSENETLEFGYHDGFADEPGHFAAMILDATPPPVDAREASKANLIAEAAYASIQTGKVITADEMPLM